MHPLRRLPPLTPGAAGVRCGPAAGPEHARWRRRVLVVLGLSLGCLLGPTPALRAQQAGGTASGLGEALAPSSASQIRLGEHLRQRGVVFYGAWWCPACFRQKNLFGKQAGDALPYVECERSEAGRQRCEAAGIRAYPTWVLGGERREGVLSLEELARWSGWSDRQP